MFYPRRTHHLFSGLLLAICCSGPITSSVEAQPQSKEWHEVSVPQVWRKTPTDELASATGYSWYRCLVRVPDAWRSAPLTLYVEALDDARATYVNGVAVGASGTFPPQYRSGLGNSARYEVPGELIKVGANSVNTIAIRVYQEDARPNFDVAPPVLINEATKQAIRMNGTWQYRAGDDKAWAVASLEEFAKSKASADTQESIVFANVDEFDDVEQYVAYRDGDRDPVPPEEAEKLFKTPDDLEVQLVLSEPDVTQPLFLTWDHRGRLWVMEYRQYPDPAGLKMVSRDVYLRTVYDKVPLPPPHHDRGRDRISIHEDTDGDGRYDQHKVFVDGLNIATSMAIGRGGVWVTNPPYLLFYPDADGDDVPDGDPEVHLEGFGLEDSHSVINSLRFGPDGWLYAAQGSTVTAHVRRPGSSEPPVRTMGQQVWRYHPEKRQFEVFAEGGGNTFGVEIDAKGRVFSGHNGGDTRGFHYVQGSYSRKGFNKHGSLSNPFAFGYFLPMKHHAVPRFTHTFVIYEADTLPAMYRGRLFGIEPLQGQVVMSSFEPDRSSFQTRDLSRPLQTEDPWFRPVDIKVGPDGCIYVADMYEQRIDHSSHYAGRIDRSNGRVYKIKPQGTREPVDFDYSEYNHSELVGLLSHPNKWHRQEALRLIGQRKDVAMLSLVLEAIQTATDQVALELLWALHLCDGLTEGDGSALLAHEDKFVRAWAVRLLCDRRVVSQTLATKLADLAMDEPTIEVRKQLASSAQRLPAEQALPIVRNLIEHDADSEDIHQPLLIWWALEKQVGQGSQETVHRALSGDEQVWERSLWTEHLARRLMKRYLMDGTRSRLLDAATFLKAAPNKASRQILLAAFEEAYQGRSLAGLPKELAQAVGQAGGGSLALRVRLEDPSAIREAQGILSDDQAELASRLQYLQIFGELRRPDSLPVLIGLATSPGSESLSTAALNALQAFEDVEIGKTVVQHFRSFGGDTKLAAESLLASRSPWAMQLLESVDAGALQSEEVSAACLRKLSLHRDPRVQQLLRKHWGVIAGATTEQMRAEMGRVQSLMRSGAGNPKRGKPLFMEHCGKCHRLFEEGGDIGPDLTSFQRTDLARVIANVVNPSAEIREGYENHMLLTADGRVVSGFLSDRDNQVVVLRDVDGRNHIVRHDEIEEQHVLPVSVMPEGTLGKLSDQQLRDLFAYFRSSQPVNY